MKRILVLRAVKEPTTGNLETSLDTTRFKGLEFSETDRGVRYGSDGKVHGMVPWAGIYDVQYETEVPAAVPAAPALAQVTQKAK